MINSGDCESNGMRMVATKKECEDAAVFLKLTDTSAYEIEKTDRPQGCVYSSIDYLSWDSPENHPRMLTCGSVHKGVTRSCICSKAGKRYYISSISDVVNLKNYVKISDKTFNIFFLPTNSLDDDDMGKDDGPTAEQCQKFIEEACPKETGRIKIIKSLPVFHH